MISDEEVRQFFREKLDIPDVVTGLFRMRKRGKNLGYHLDAKFSLQVVRGMAPHLWKDANSSGCIRHIAVFNDFGVIPKYCFDCYKVVIAPRTVIELFKLLMTYERLTLPNNNTRKCMLENRQYCSGTYKGYVYIRGIEEGQEVYRTIRGAVSENISPEVSVEIKRGCSEYAQVYPEFAQVNAEREDTEYRKDWQFYEDFVDEYYVFDEQYINHDVDDKAYYSMRELFAMQYWLKYAATVGDISYLSVNGGKTLEPMPQQ